jgi:hypothetical protein
MLVSNAGLAFSIHYCGGNISSIALNEQLPSSSPDSCCSHLSVNKKCCSDKIISIADGSDRVVEKIFSQHYMVVGVLTGKVNFDFANGTNISRIAESISYAFLSTGPPLFKLLCQFIFYA